jgi:hypothetical protein
MAQKVRFDTPCPQVMDWMTCHLDGVRGRRAVIEACDKFDINVLMGFGRVSLWRLCVARWVSRAK